MISLSAPTYDPIGSLIFPLDRLANIYQGERRGTVTATLDGGSAIYDGGHSESDQTWTATLRRASRADLVRLQYLVAYYGEVILCCEGGAFRALLSFASRGAVTVLALRLVARLNTDYSYT